MSCSRYYATTHTVARMEHMDVAGDRLAGGQHPAWAVLYYVQLASPPVEVSHMTVQAVDHFNVDIHPELKIEVLTMASCNSIYIWYVISNAFL